MLVVITVWLIKVMPASLWYQLIAFITSGIRINFVSFLISLSRDRHRVGSMPGLGHHANARNQQAANVMDLCLGASEIFCVRHVALQEEADMLLHQCFPHHHHRT